MEARSPPEPTFSNNPQFLYCRINDFSRDAVQWEDSNPQTHMAEKPLDLWSAIRSAGRSVMPT